MRKQSYLIKFGWREAMPSNIVSKVSITKQGVRIDYTTPDGRKNWVRKDRIYDNSEAVITIPARCAILPDSKDGMLYQPCVLNPHKVYDTLWNFIAKQFPQAKPDMIKHDNKILNASKTVQDEFVLSGIRW